MHAFRTHCAFIKVPSAGFQTRAVARHHTRAMSSAVNYTTTMRLNYRPENDLFLRKVRTAPDFGPHAPLVVVAVLLTLLVIGELGQFLLAQRRISTGAEGNYVVLPWLRYLGTPQFFTKEYRYLAKTLQRFPGSWFRFRVREVGHA